METHLADFIKDTAAGKEADAILRSCVHCGFCTATCPTYQLLGDELDGPRGRIYLIKEVLEGHPTGRTTQMHLDRCLTCRSCETTCPSGVRYGRLLDIGRAAVEERVARSPAERIARRLLLGLLPYPRRVAPLLRLGQALRPLLPSGLRRKVPVRRPDPLWPAPRGRRTMVVLDGCVQPSMLPGTNAAAARVLDRLGIDLVRAEGAGCCGALSHHLCAHEDARRFVRRNIDAWWPYIERGAEALVMTASGCGAMVREYGHLLRDDPSYAERASRVSALTRDLAEVVAAQDYEDLGVSGRGIRVAFHPPCTLQHGQRIVGVVEGILRRLGFELTPVRDAHLCCGSAGTYSVLEPALSAQLLARKIEALEAERPHCIATANIGCQLHLESAAQVPVRHWIELLDPRSVPQTTGAPP